MQNTSQYKDYGGATHKTSKGYDRTRIFFSGISMQWLGSLARVTPAVPFAMLAFDQGCGRGVPPIFTPRSKFKKGIPLRSRIR